jgi:membrane-associated phospholipid phosphatase
VLVAFSRIYLRDHYPVDVLSGALSGMAFAEIVRRVQRMVLPE